MECIRSMLFGNTDPCERATTQTHRKKPLKKMLANETGLGTAASSVAKTENKVESRPSSSTSDPICGKQAGPRADCISMVHISFHVSPRGPVDQCSTAHPLTNEKNDARQQLQFVS